MTESDTFFNVKCPEHKKSIFDKDIRLKISSRLVHIDEQFIMKCEQKIVQTTDLSEKRQTTRNILFQSLGNDELSVVSKSGTNHDEHGPTTQNYIASDTSQVDIVRKLVLEF